MDSMNTFEIILEPSVVGCPTNLKDEDSSRKPLADEAVPQADQVSNKIKTKSAKKSEGKNFKQPAKEGKLSLKRKKPTKEDLPVIRKKANTLPISQMVMESIKALRKRNGASVVAILEHMKVQYKVDAKLVKHYVSMYLLSAVQTGTVELISGAGDEGKFKIKKAEKIAKVEKKSKANQKIVKAGKITKTGQKFNDNQKKIKAKQVATGQYQNQKKTKGENVTKVQQ